MSARLSLEMLLENGQRGFDAHDFSMARECFNAVVKEVSNHPQAHFGLARLALMQGQLDDATAHLAQSSDEATSELFGYAIQLTRCLQCGDLQNATKILDEALRLSATLPEMTLLRAQVALVQDQFDEAKQLAHQALEEGVPVDQAHYYLGLAHLGCEEFEASIECFIATISANPLHVDGYLHLGKMARALGVIEEMIALFQNGVLLNSENTDLKEELCELYLLANQIEPAFEQAVEVLQYRQGVNDFLRAADLALALDRVEAAFEGYEKALLISPDNVQALLGLGRIYFHGRAYEKAQEHIEKALSIEPAQPEALNAMASLLMEAKQDYSKARELLHKALAQNNDSPQLRLNLLICEFLAEEWANVIQLEAESKPLFRTMPSFATVVEKLLLKAKQNLPA